MNYLSYKNLIDLIPHEIGAFEKLIQDITYENKGILYSEMFFLYLCLKDNPPKKIFESGRARGQSTLILSRIFPDTQIISIEHDENSVDVPIAFDRLKNCHNVQMLFGDAAKLLPELTAKYPGNVVLIDGPKGYRALRLAFKLAENKIVTHIFIHDTTYDTSERLFLEKFLPSVMYSDNLELSALTRTLDESQGVLISESYRMPGKPYGFSLACIRPEKKSLRRLILLSRFDQTIRRLTEKMVHTKDYFFILWN